MQFVTKLLLAAVLLAPIGCKGSVETETGRKAKTPRYFDLINLDVRDVPLLMTLGDLAGQGYQVEKTYLASGALIADA